jgi:hypothetical protein
MAILWIHFAVSLALAAVLWVVQLVIYPAFRHIAPETFERWHYDYTGAITWVVAPLILTQTTGVAARLVILGKPNALWWLEALCTAIAWAVTATVSVPLHNRLQRARCEAAMTSLVRSNWWRTAAWSTTAICSAIAAMQ